MTQRFNKRECLGITRLLHRGSDIKNNESDGDDDGEPARELYEFYEVRKLVSPTSEVVATIESVGVIFLIVHTR